MKCVMYGHSHCMQSDGQHGNMFQACNMESKHFQVSAGQSEQWFDAETISVEAAQLGGEEEKEQPDAASPAQLLPEVAM